MIKTIFFDIGGVLIDIHPEKTYQYISDCVDLSPDIIEKKFPWEAHNEYEKGYISDRDWFMAVKEALPQPCCLKESDLSLIHISEPTRPERIADAVVGV